MVIAPSIDPYNVLARVASGDAEAKIEAERLLLEGAIKFIVNRGAISLERCCGFPEPTARRAWARLERNFWLCRAGGLIKAEFPWHRAVKLAEEVAAFQSRILPTWRDLATPPPDASELRTCLWHAHRADPGNFPESARRFADILQVGGITTQDDTQ